MKRKSGIVFLSGLLASTQVFSATLTPNFERGEKNIYHMSPRGIQEVCVIPKHYPDAKYSKKDLEKELELCQSSFYDVTPEEAAQGMKTVALCAKENSTNPGVNIYELEANQSKSQVENNDCKDASKLGKYKNSISCSSTPAILGYYHLSRILGSVGRVPVSVLRSMDIEEHKKLGNEAMRSLESQKKTADLIYQTWSGLMANLKPGSAKANQLLSDNGDQSYGAFIVNPKGEDFYSDLFTKGTDRAVAFKTSNPIFALVRDGRPLDKMFSNAWSQDSIQKMVAMKDASEFILMDHIMNQQDRFGNIAKIEVLAYMGKDKAEDTDYKLQFETEKNYKKDLADGLVDQSKKPLAIKSMVLKDNDCGVTKTNVVKAAGILKEIRHMDGKTYKKLLQFQSTMASNKSFFTSNLMFTDTDFSSVSANLNDAVNILKANCKSGFLKLDLDVDGYIENGSIKVGSCDLQ